MNRWPTKLLGELVTDLQPGFACRPSESGTETPQIRPLNLTELGTLTLDGTKSVECSASQTSRYSLLSRDVLFNNTNSPELVGKVAVFRESGRFVFSNHITRIRVHRDELLPEFLHRFLFKVWSDGFFQHHCTQWVNQAAINVGALAKVTVPVPPLAEQERIVKLLDEADELRKLRAQADRRTADLIPALFHDMFGDPAVSPKGWNTVPLGNLTKRITKGESPGWQGYDYCDDGPIFVTSENVLWGKLDVSDPKRIPLEFHNKLSRSSLQPRDILVNLVGASIGRACIVPEDIGAANINQAVAVVSLLQNLEPQYLLALLLSGSGQGILHGGKVEGARANISLTDLREFPVSLPPLSLQRDFAARVAEIRAMATQQTATRRRLDDLFRSLLHRAFQGEL